ncbi:MAG: hypothetical protein IPK03_00045 [Bacteroidetes bacterium]|nr:hypothetical protein [Bacteroidota bacterium]
MKIINKTKISIFISVVLLLVSCTPDTIVNNTAESINTVKVFSTKLNKTFVYKKLSSQTFSDTIFLSKSISDTFQVTFFNEVSGSVKRTYV